MIAAAVRSAPESSRWSFDAAVPRPSPPPPSRLGARAEVYAIGVLTFVLLVVGLLTLASASAAHAVGGDLPHDFYLTRHGVGILVGLVATGVLACTPTAWLQRAAHPILLAAVVLLTVVILPFTEAIAPTWNGARRWLRVGVTIQPSDLAKLAVVVWVASLAVRKRSSLGSLRRGLAPVMVGAGTVAVLVALGPDYSTAALIAALSAIIVFTAGARVSHFVFLGAALTPLAYRLFSTGYHRERFAGLLLDPGPISHAAQQQVKQSLIALGSGGFLGVGFGEGHQQFGFLPEHQNDYVFALIGEEWGLAGAVVVIALFLALVILGFRVARRARDPFGRLLAVGVSSLIGLQAFVHIGVCLAVLPATGLSMPFISYGRTNLVAMLAGVGILIAVSREASRPEPRRRAVHAGGAAW